MNQRAKKDKMAQNPDYLKPEDSGVELVPLTSAMDAATRSEINMQVAFAMEHPRSIEKSLKEMETLVTMNQEIAEEAFYTLKRKDKDGNIKLIQGPSIRFAEVLCYCWGNARWQKQIADIDAEFVTGEGVFMDLQRNIIGKVRTKRRITDSGGRRYGADMIQTTGNASASLAYRNAITGSIPQALWKGILEKAKIAAVGGTQSIGEKRIAAIEYGKKIGVSPEQVFATLGVQGINDLGIDELVTLRGLYNSLKDGEMSVEEAFGDPHEDEIKALMDQLGWNQGRRTMALSEYRGKSMDLLNYLKKQAEPLNVGKEKAPEAAPTQNTQQQAGNREAPPETKKKAGRPKKDQAPPAAQTGETQQAATTETAQAEEKKPEPEQKTQQQAPAAGSFNF